jgi:hypothetical protein
MKTTQVLVCAVVANLVLATTSFAARATSHTDLSTAVAQYLELYKVQRTDIPLPVKVVAPEGLPWNFRPTTFNVTMLIDSDGRPQNIKIASKADAELTKLLVSALSQWRFSPARKNGVPVAQMVTLPLRVS